MWVLRAGGSVVLTSRETQVAIAGGLDNGLTGGVYVFTFLAGIGTPLVMGVYLMLGIAGVSHGRRIGDSRFRVVGGLVAVVGALALFGSLYYSFVEGAPGAGIPLVVAVVPWVCLAIAVCGLAVAACGRESATVPSALLGRWESDDSAYAGRALLISRHALVFASSTTASENFAIRGVESSTQEDGSLAVSIEYGTRQQDLTLRVRRFATDPPSLKIGDRPERWTFAASGGGRR